MPDAQDGLSVVTRSWSSDQRVLRPAVREVLFNLQLLNLLAHFNSSAGCSNPCLDPEFDKYVLKMLLNSASARAYYNGDFLVCFPPS